MGFEPEGWPREGRPSGPLASGPINVREPLLRIDGVTKWFGPVVACSGITLDVREGEILGLLGQNGAGKTTLMRVVAGLLPQDDGRVEVGGRQCPPGDSRAAIDLGIAMVHQHFSLVGPLTVWENVALYETGRVDSRRTIGQIASISETYGLEIDPMARVQDLSAGQRQRVEIAKCLRRDPRVVVLDEPTSVLTEPESRRLFEVLRELVETEGRAVVLVSHKLDEILHATHRVAVMRDGHLASVFPTPSTDARMLAREMLGREVQLTSERAVLGMDAAISGEGAPSDEQWCDGNASRRAETGGYALEIVDATVRAPDGRRLLDGLSLSVRDGEILGVAGVEGNGQDVLIDVLAGLVSLASGSLSVGGLPIDTGRGAALLDIGIGVIPSDRHDAGCVLGMTVAENLVLGRERQFSDRGFVNYRRLSEYAHRVADEFQIVTSTIDAPMWSLSGGNQQRVVLARELARASKVLVAAHPTRGLDVGAIEYMWERLRRAAADGIAVLLVSAELEEILTLSQRISVIHRGRIVGELEAGEVSLEKLGLLMGGQA